MLVRARGGLVAPAAELTRGYATVEVVDDSDLLAGLSLSFGAPEPRGRDHADFEGLSRSLEASGVPSRKVIDDRPVVGDAVPP